jgi:hypothetical protein
MHAPARIAAAREPISKCAETAFGPDRLRGMKPSLLCRLTFERLYSERHNRNSRVRVDRGNFAERFRPREVGMYGTQF